MDDIGRLKAGILAADAAGDSEGVAKLGAEYRRLSALQQAPQEQHGKAWAEAQRRGLHPEIPGAGTETGDALAQKLLEANPEHTDKTFGERAGEIATSGVDAAVAVPAFAVGTGAASKLPALAKYAPSIAKALKSITPQSWPELLKMMGIGAAGGVAGDAASQATEAAGGSTTAQRVAEFVAPMLGYGTGVGIAKTGAAAIPGSAKRSAEKLVKKISEGGKRIYPTQQEAALGGASANLRGSTGETSVTADDLAAILKRHADQLTAKAKAEADAIRATAPDKAEEIERNAGSQIADLENHFKPIAEKLRARGESAATGAEKVKAGNATLRADRLGQESERGGLGGEARAEIGKNMDALKQARNEQADQDKTAWTSLAESQEQGGQFIDRVPEYRAIVSDVKNWLGGTGSGVAAVDENTRRGLQSIFKSLTLEGHPKAAGIEELRRRLGDEAKGIPETGYSAIGQHRAQELYDRLSVAMEQFTPGFRNYLDNYAKNSQPLYAFMGRLGKTASDKEGFDWTRYAHDASDLPSALFKSRQSVNNFREMLGGDKYALDYYATKHASRELRGMTAASAKSWLNKANDWIGELSPEARAKIEGYVSELGRREGGAKNLERAAGQHATALKGVQSDLNTGTKKISDMARAARDKAMTETERNAGQVEATAQARAAEVLSGGNPVQKLKSLLTSGNSKENLQKVVDALAADPKGKETLLKGTREILSEVTPKNVGKVYRESVEPALKASGMYTGDELSNLKSLVESVDTIANADVISGKEVSDAIGDKMRSVLRQTAGGYLLLTALGAHVTHGASEVAELTGAAGMAFGGYWRYKQMLTSFVHDILADPDLIKAAVDKPTPKNMNVLAKAMGLGVSGVVGSETAKMQDSE